MERRELIAAFSTLGTAGVAGCLDRLEGAQEPTDDGDDAEDGESGNEDGPTETVEEHVAAAVDRDWEAMEETTHTVHPVDYLEVAEDADDGAEIGPEGDGDPEAEVIEKDLTADDVLGVREADLFFEETVVEDALEGERTALVRSEDPDSDGTSLWVLVTEDGDWRILWQGEEFEPEIPDDETDIDAVDKIEYKVDDMGEFGDAYHARVHFSEDADVGVDRVRVVSTESEGEAEIWSDDGDTLDLGRNINHLLVEVDPGGDEVIVMVTVDGEESVVHRDEVTDDEF